RFGKQQEKVFKTVGYKWTPTGRTFTLVGNVCPLTRIATTPIVPRREPIPIVQSTNKPVVTLVVQTVLWYLDSDCSKHMTGDRSQLINFVQKFLGTVKFGNDHVAKITGYGDYQIGNVTISRVYYVEGLRSGSANRFSGNNLYTLSLQDMMAYSLICLLSKASKTKSWLWHRRLSHLNFGAINHLARQGLVRGLPKLKFEKDHLCSACAMGKSTKKSHKPKSEDTNQEKLYLLHMDLCGLMRVESVNGKKHILVIVDDYSRFTWVKFLRKKKTHKPKSKDTNQEKLYLLHIDACGPMRVESVNGKKYILVIVDDYSRFTWVKFLRSKDEAPDFIIKFLKMIQIRLKVPVRPIRNIRTNNETEFFLIKLCETTMNSLEPALHETTPATPSSRLVLNHPPSASFVPPSRKEWDLVFQPVFDEFYSPLASIASPVLVVEAPAPVESTGLPSSTSVDQDAPSPSTSQTT
nr:hypothetical protein [Tanacetum cinerariifolium]